MRQANELKDNELEALTWKGASGYPEDLLPHGRHRAGGRKRRAVGRQRTGGVHGLEVLDLLQRRALVGA
jgi:hypothetical protein